MVFQNLLSPAGGFYKTPSVHLIIYSGAWTEGSKLDEFLKKKKEKKKTFFRTSGSHFKCVCGGGGEDRIMMMGWVGLWVC